MEKIKNGTLKYLIKENYDFKARSDLYAQERGGENTPAAGAMDIADQSFF